MWWVGKVVETAVHSVTRKPGWGLPNVEVKGIMLEAIGKSDQRRRNETKHKEIEVTREKGSVTGHGVWAVVVCAWSAAMSGVERSR